MGLPLRREAGYVRLSLAWQLVALTLAALIVAGWLAWRGGSWIDLWLTPDQQARLAWNRRDFPLAAETFEDPAWKGVAAYRAGLYTESAAAFGRIPKAEAFYNRGNAFMKGREYAKAIASYEQATAEAPAWTEATKNLELARYVLDYIERSREQSDTQDESEMSADDYVFDNTKKKGLEMTITDESTIEAASAEKWMRSVDTRTSEFLRTRFLLESARQGGRQGEP